MNPIAFDSSVFSSVMIILLAGGGVQSIVTLQFLLTGIGVRSIFLGFCAGLLGVWIGVVRLEPTLQDALDLNQSFLPSVHITPESSGKIQSLLKTRVDPRIEALLQKSFTSERAAGLSIKVLLSDLSRGMLAGLILLIPFVLIDMVVQHIFRLLEFEGLSVSVVSLPLKVLLFISVDGWAMLSERFLS